MKIGVVHQISDPERAQKQGQTLFDPHAGVQLVQFVPSHDFRTATCIWESDSIETVRELVDGALGDTSRQTYFEVATAQAVGMPQTAAPATTA
jgi:hypothetical protein